MSAFFYFKISNALATSSLHTNGTQFPTRLCSGSEMEGKFFMNLLEKEQNMLNEQNSFSFSALGLCQPAQAYRNLVLLRVQI